MITDYSKLTKYGRGGMADKCREIAGKTVKNQYTVGKYLWGEPVEGEDHEFLCWLLQRHPSADAKIGVGVDHFEVGATPQFPNFASLFIIRTDGTRETFSWKYCIDARHASQRSKVLNALRREIRPQIIKFKQDSLDYHPYCAVTGAHVTMSTSHADHFPVTFQELADSFISDYGGYDAIETHSAADIGDELTSNQIAEQWRNYHQSNACLRLVKPEVNLGKAKS